MEGKKVTAQRGNSGATAPWNCQGACLKGEMKTTSSLEVWHNYLKVKFGSNPKYNKFFSKLQEKQAQTVSKFCNLSNWVAPKKQKSKEQDYQEDVQKVVKKKYKVAEIKKYLEDVVVGHAILKTASQKTPSQNTPSQFSAISIY
ncbi:hypothetical protein DSO57_1028657 [Entomophthora muscae]|uniref:Uncharacterized protein n=1 Tax=Entomophthora muscae TaxID=34485 RepID=A0ACC2RG69_9FUNG|nr:hypothetical protein DSO57_1028657 [Entomophthora muscae]